MGCDSRPDKTVPSSQMQISWTAHALEDLVRLHEFLKDVNPAAAARAIQSLVGGAGQLQQFPRLGPKLPEFSPRDVRRILIGDYELRYEITPAGIHVLRLWHARETR